MTGVHPDFRKRPLLSSIVPPKMGKRGASLQMAGGADGVQCRLVQADAALTPSQLAAWVEQF